jgi:hypothetical protein
MNLNIEEQIQALTKAKANIDKQLQQLKLKEDDSRKAVEKLLIKKCDKEIKEFKKLNKFKLTTDIVVKTKQYIELELGSVDFLSDCFNFDNFSEIDRVVDFNSKDDFSLVGDLK